MCSIDSLRQHFDIRFNSREKCVFLNPLSPAQNGPRGPFFHFLLGGGGIGKRKSLTTRYFSGTIRSFLFRYRCFMEDSFGGTKRGMVFKKGGVKGEKGSKRGLIL